MMTTENNEVPIPIADRSEDFCNENVTDYVIFDFYWDEVHTPYIIVIWIMLALCVRIGK